MSPGAQGGPRRRRGLAVGGALGALTAVAFVLAWIAPGWWAPVARDAAGALDTARALEQGVASELTKVRGPGTQAWAVRLRDADANAWLGARLPQWLEFDQSLPWPEGVDAVQMHTTPRGLTLAARWHGFVVSTNWRIEPGTGGAPATIVADGTSVGLLPIPFAAGVGAWFVPQLAKPLPLDLKLGDGRRVRVMGVDFSDGEAVADCETVARP